MTSKVLRPTTIIPPGLYVERAADRQLRSIVNDMGRPGYVLVARQMGKTNLLLNMKRERVDDTVLYMDLSNRRESARSWFRSLIDALIDAAPEDFAPASSQISSLRSGSPLEPSVEYDRSLRHLLKSISRRVVIILDEIDSLVHAAYSDSILAQVRSMYFSRVNHPEYSRLTYVLSGVIEPTDLIKDKNISPFNIGEKIYLDDFTQSEFDDFIVKSRLILPQAVRERIFHWTSGHPRMTWDICSEIEDQVISGARPDCNRVDELVKKLYLTNYDRAPIDHIRTLVESDPTIRSAVVAIRYGRASALDDKAKARLYLAGIVRSSGSGAPDIKNNVVEAALSDRWIDQLASARRTILLAAEDSYRQRDYEEAVRQYENAISAAGKDEDLDLVDRMNLGLSYLWTGRHDRAIPHLTKCLDDATEPKIRQKIGHWIGASHALGGNPQSAIAFLEASIEGPDESFSRQSKVTLASVLIQIAPKENSQRCLALIADVLTPKDHEESEELRSTQASALFNRARLNSILERRPTALRDLEEALTLATPEATPTIHYWICELGSDANEKRISIRNACRAILDQKLKPLATPLGGLQLTRDGVASIIASVAALHEVDEAIPLVEHVRSQTLDAPLSRLDVTIDLYDALTSKEKRRSFIAVIRYILDVDGSDDQQPVTLLKAFRALSLGTQPSDAAGWISRYLRALMGSVTPDALSEEDALALMQIYSMIRTLGDRTLAAEILSAHDMFSLAISDRYPIVNVVMIMNRMRYHSESGNAEAASQVAKALTMAIDGLRKESVEDVGFWESMQNLRKEATRIQNARNPKSISGDPYRRIGRNQKIFVRYGESLPIERKFKFVEGDLRAGRCSLVTENESTADERTRTSQ